MVRDDIGQIVEPEVRNRCEHDALAGDRVGQDHVECGHPVRCDDEQMRIVNAINIPYFASREQRETVEIGFVDGRALRLTHVGSGPCGLNALRLE